MDYITSHEAVKILEVSRVSLAKYVKQGKIRVVKMNADLPRPSIMYLEADVHKMAIDREAKKLYA